MEKIVVVVLVVVDSSKEFKMEIDGLLLKESKHFALAILQRRHSEVDEDLIGFIPRNFLRRKIPLSFFRSLQR